MDPDRRTTRTGRTSAGRTPTTTPPRSKGASKGGYGDIVLLAILAVFAALVAWVIPEGSQARLVLTLPVLMVAPGYLLIQAFNVPPSRPAIRFVQGLLSLGVSPAVVGLLALSTALLPGGFGATQIIGVVTLWCLVVGAIGVMRRTNRASVSASAVPAATAQLANK